MPVINYNAVINRDRRRLRHTSGACIALVRRGCVLSHSFPDTRNRLRASRPLDSTRAHARISFRRSPLINVRSSRLLFRDFYPLEKVPARVCARQPTFRHAARRVASSVLGDAIFVRIPTRRQFSCWHSVEISNPAESRLGNDFKQHFLRPPPDDRRALGPAWVTVTRVGRIFAGAVVKLVTEY